VHTRISLVRYPVEPILFPRFDRTRCNRRALKLGELHYESTVKNEALSPDAANIEAKITDLKKQISEKEDEMKKINEDKAEVPAAATLSTKTCPSYGKENEANVKFCSEYGAKLP